ncbi:MAG: ABC transporter ATP-binding protein [Bacillota bacterium]|jgi:iron complex transport system ATP-binding protein|nr:ABC transporter ATP-binding protein [Bacillota bacterium]HOB91687.1 ABC transporter ATP-binding protein [Bacillota bacterium]
MGTWNHTGTTNRVGPNPVGRGGSTRSAIELKQWSVDLGGRRILSDISLSASRGELVGLVGPNGAGKSTLLKSIIKCPSPVSGSGMLFGEDISSMSPRQIARAAALMPQNLLLDFAFSTEEVVMMGRHPYLSRFESESEEDWGIVWESMRKTDTLGLVGRRVTSISGGEAQLISMAKTLAQTTPIMLLDEPTASLDLRHQELIFAVVREFVMNGGCAIIAIHDLALAARYCTRVVLLKEGMIVADGPVHEVFTPELLSDVYGIKVVVYTDPVTHAPTVLPVIEDATARPED